MRLKSGVGQKKILRRRKRSWIRRSVGSGSSCEYIFKKHRGEDGTAVEKSDGFHWEANMKMLEEEKVDGYIPDNRFRKKD